MKAIKVLVPAVLVVVIVLPLFAVPKPSDIPPLMNKLKSENAKERLAAIKELGGIGLVKAAYVKQAVPGILQAAKDDKDMDVRLAALTALGQINPDAEEAVPVFIEALKTNDDRLQIAALQGIVYFGPKAKAALAEVNRIQAEIRKLDKDAQKKKRNLQKAAGAAADAITGRGKG
ncbi:MAG: HEAT repeat domain-containing protein [Gemmataceae bacterium]